MKTNFLACQMSARVLEPIFEAAKFAAARDAVLLSPAGVSLGSFRDRKYPGAPLSPAVKSIGWGALAGNPNRHGGFAAAAETGSDMNENLKNLPRVFLRKNPMQKRPSTNQNLN